MALKVCTVVNCTVVKCTLLYHVTEYILCSKQYLWSVYYDVCVTACAEQQREPLYYSWVISHHDTGTL